MFGSNKVPSVSVADVDLGTFLLDVREDDEWAAGHLEGSTHIAMNEIPGRVAELPTDSLITVVCRSGNRSGQVTAWLVSGGIDAVNLAGGLLGWAMAGRPLVADGDVEPYVL